MLAARAVAPFARDAIFEKWLRLVPVQSVSFGLNTAGVTL
jgi:hypothetical protein